MHLSISCPNGESAGIYGLLTRKRCPCQGKFDSFYQGIPRVGIIDILDRGGLGLLLTSHHALPREEGNKH